VYYDFILFFKGTFTFPYIRPGSVRVKLHNHYAPLGIPCKVGDIKQYMGMDDPRIFLYGGIDSAAGWGSPHGQYLYYIFLHAHEEPWQWFTSDLGNFKVVPVDLEIEQDSEVEDLKRWRVELGMFNMAGGGETQMKDGIEWLGFDWT